MSGPRPWIAFLLLVAGCGDPPPPPEPPRLVDLPNFQSADDGISSGGTPAEAGQYIYFKAFSIRTLICVDGAAPDAAAAKAHGVRHVVHIPVGYSGITREQTVLLCKAATELPWPIYVHCHHGKHRGPTAVALIQRFRNRWTPYQAREFLKTAGTDPRYEGLYANVRDFTPPTADELKACPSVFPEKVDVGGLAARMVEIDEVWDRIKKQPAATDAVQLVEHYREAVRLTETEKRGPTFQSSFAEAAAAARELEAALRDGNDTARKAAFDRSAGLCVNCHREFRDKPRK